MNNNEYYTCIRPFYAWENDSECCNKHILPRTQYKRCLLGPRFSWLSNFTVKFTATCPFFQLAFLASTVICGSASYSIMGPLLTIWERDLEIKFVCICITSFSSCIVSSWPLSALVFLGLMPHVICLLNFKGGGMHVDWFWSIWWLCLNKTTLEIQYSYHHCSWVVKMTTIESPIHFQNMAMRPKFNIICNTYLLINQMPRFIILTILKAFLEPLGC